MLGLNTQAPSETEEVPEFSDDETEEAEEDEENEEKQPPRRITRSSNQSPKLKTPLRHRIVHRDSNSGSEHSDPEFHSDDFNASASSTKPKSKSKPSSTTHQKKLGSREQSSFSNTALDDSDSDVQITGESMSTRPPPKSCPRIRSDSDGTPIIK